MAEKIPMEQLKQKSIEQLTLDVLLRIEALLKARYPYEANEIAPKRKGK